MEDLFVCNFCGGQFEGGFCINCGKHKDEGVARVNGMPVGVR